MTICRPLQIHFVFAQFLTTVPIIIISLLAFVIYKEQISSKHLFNLVNGRQTRSK